MYVCMYVGMYVTDRLVSCKKKSTFLRSQVSFFLALSSPNSPSSHVSRTRLRLEMVGRGVHEVYINGGSTDIALISYRSKGGLKQPSEKSS